MPITVPVAAGPPVAVTTEIGYDAFPWGLRDAAGRAWVAYSHSGGHVSAASDVRLRHAEPGKTWSAPTVVATGADGFGVGVAGLAAETSEHGGRLWLATLKYQPTGPASATNYSTSVRSLDSSNGLWSAAIALPSISTTQTIGSGLLVRPDGTLLASAYGTPPAGGYMVGKVYAYDRTANTWSTLSTLTLPGRHLQEPTLVTLADGRLMLLARSDGTPPYYSYLYATVSPDGGATWGTPYKIATHASGMPHGHVLPNGQVAVTYRRSSEPTNPAAAYPPGVTMLNPDGTGTGDGGIDLLGGQTARFLYGRIIAGGSEPDQFVYSLEGPEGQSGQGAAIYSVPLAWVERTG